MVLKERTQSSYKLIIPDKVEEVIRYLQHKYPGTEWSGVLFTSHTGSFASKDLVITCDAIYPMDLGNSTSTSYKLNEDVMNFMVNKDLVYSDINLIHSHHSMAAFASGTDTNTLLLEGQDATHFVSLIVNNNGPYWAAITRKATIKLECRRVVSYECFDQGIVEEELPNPEETMIEYFKLDIQRNENLDVDFNDPKFKWIDDRFVEIIASKPKPIFPSYNQNGYWGNYYSGSEIRFGDYNREVQSLKTAKQSNFYNTPKKQETIVKKEPVQSNMLFDEDNVEIIVPDEVVDEFCCILATGNILAYSQHKSYDLNIEDLFLEYQKDFDEKFKQNSNIEAFKLYADAIVDWCLSTLCDNLDYKYIDMQYADVEFDDISLFNAALAQKVIDALNNMNITNDYIEYYIKELTRATYIW